MCNQRPISRFFKLVTTNIRVHEVKKVHIYRDEGKDVFDVGSPHPFPSNHLNLHPKKRRQLGFTSSISVIIMMYIPNDVYFGTQNHVLWLFMACLMAFPCITSMSPKKLLGDSIEVESLESPQHTQDLLGRFVGTIAPEFEEMSQTCEMAPTRLIDEFAPDTYFLKLSTNGNNMGHKDGILGSEKNLNKDVEAISQSLEGSSKSIIRQRLNWPTAQHRKWIERSNELNHIRPTGNILQHHDASTFKKDITHLGRASASRILKNSGLSGKGTANSDNVSPNNDAVSLQLGLSSTVQFKKKDTLSGKRKICDDVTGSGIDFRKPTSYFYGMGQSMLSNCVDMILDLGIWY